MRYRARVEYDGTEFAGFQFQPTARTVQGVLEAALAQIHGGRRIRVEAAGRTDAGVHAAGQVIAFTAPAGIRSGELRRSLDALLPRDVAVHALRRTGKPFRPRADATWREYRYTIWNGPRSPLRERHALGVRAPLDVAAMAEAARVFVGRHDFSAYGGSHRQPVRTVQALEVRRRGRAITVDIRADAFLRQMVRSIVAALLRVGRGEATTEQLATALTSGERAFAGTIAPPHGLCLRRVAFGRQGFRPVARQSGEEADHASVAETPAGAGNEATRR